MMTVVLLNVIILTVVARGGGGGLTRTIFTAVINNVSVLVTLLRVINFQA
jgi:hypothetical protein